MAKQTFEQMMARLEQITAAIGGDVGFDEAMKLYTEAVGIVKTLSAELIDRRGKIRELQEELDGIIRLFDAEDK